MNNGEVAMVVIPGSGEILAALGVVSPHTLSPQRLPAPLSTILLGTLINQPVKLCIYVHLTPRHAKPPHQAAPLSCARARLSRSRA
jgi:hypothetical protein